MLRALTRQTLQEILEVRDWPCVSFFLPTHRYGPEAVGDRAQLKRLLREAESDLKVAGLTPGATEEFLRPIVGLSEDVVFWKSQVEGLAIFAATGNLLAVRLDVAVEPAVKVGRRFFVSPLIPALPLVERFYVLALGLQLPRILEVTPERIRRLELPGMPLGMREALGYDEYYSDVQVHSASPGGFGRQSPIFHGHGDDDEERGDQNLVHYFRRIVEALRQLPDHAAPLVLASVAEHLPLFRQAGGAEGLVSTIVTGSPERMPDQELASRAKDAAAETARGERGRALLRYQELVERSRATDDPELIVTAANAGRVDTLFLVPGTSSWGSFDPDTFEVRIHTERQPGDDDLVNLAVSMTLDNRGAVSSIPVESAPDGASLSAILRY